MKKVIFVTLLIVLCCIWGYNIYQLIPSSDSAPFRVKEQGYNAYSKTDGDETCVYSRIPKIKCSGDPFLPFFIKVEAQPKAIKNETIPDAPPPSVVYHGLVRTKKGKNAIVSIGGQITDIVEGQDEQQGIKIISFNEDELKYRYKGKLYATDLGSGY